MKLVLEKSLPLFFVSILLAGVASVSATDTTVPLQIPISGNTAITVCTGDFCAGIGEYISIIYKWAVGFAVVAAVIALTWGGILWMTAGGGKRTDEAKKVIGNAIAGLLLALCSYLLLATISPQYISFQPIHIPGIAPIKLKLEEYKEPISVARSDLSINDITYNSLFKKYSNEAGIDCTFVKAMAYQESGFQNLGANSAGAVGLLQVVHSKYGRPSESELMDPETNIKWGTGIMKDALQNGCPSSCGSNPVFTGCIKPSNFINVANSTNTAFTDGIQYSLAAYNAGVCGANRASTNCPGVARWQCTGEIPRDETLKHVQRVFGHYKKMKDNNWGC